MKGSTHIVLNFRKKKNFSILRSFAQIIYKGLVAEAATYANPDPTVLVFKAHITNLTKAINAWGVKGNRGSHADHVNLKLAAEVVRNDIRKLKGYCEWVTPYDAFSLSKVGWELNDNGGAPAGPFSAPSNLRVVRRKFVQGMLHYRWDKVPGAKAYKVWTGTGEIIPLPPDQNLHFDVVTKAGYDDFAPSGSQRWIIVCCIGTNPESGYSSLPNQIIP